ncbi:MAG: type II toxin-antitoxin system VapC family toxin [Chloroflexi bacterium]|nr:type II toxin-antitoxin system VapC family toxin [Chloroflexota bacterium]
MSRIVLDASVATSWLLDDEQDPHSFAALARVKRDGAVVPQHWRFEVANALLFAERRGRLHAGEAHLHLHTLNDLSIQSDDGCDFDTTFTLAFEHNLTFYDALYLELALRRELPLATLDHDLERAARSAGIEVVSV